MLKQSEVEGIIKLIHNGFDLELLSFEFDIPIEEMQKYKKQLQLGKFSKDIDKNLEELKVQIPKKKSSNIRKKEKHNGKEEKDKQEDNKQEAKKDYEAIIERYKKEIASNPKDVLNKRNLLAFAYFSSGKISQARDELLSLIEQYNSHTAYRQLVYLEKSEGNLEDAKLWAYEAIEKYPDSIAIRKQLISIAREEKNNAEVISLLREIIKIQPENKKIRKEMMER